MTEVMLFHHARGLTPGVQQLAQRLESAGHSVHLPDLYDGRTFPDVDSGVAHAQQVGFGRLVELAGEVASGLPAEVAFIGISLGAMPAAKLAQTRDGALGAVLIAAGVPPDHFAETWPSAVPVQIHAMDGDSWFDEGDREAAEALVAASDDGALYEYPGTAHLFMEAEELDQEATDLMVERILALLGRVDGAG